MKNILPLLSVVATLLTGACGSPSDRNGGTGHEIEELVLDHAPQFPVDRWERRQEPVLTGFLHAYQPCVREVPDTEYPYRMWFFGWILDITNSEYPGCDAIYHARSKDLDHWEVFCKDGSWDGAGNVGTWASTLFSSMDEQKHYYDTWHVGDPSVVLKDGVYYMAFSATSRPLPEPLPGFPSGMMLCVMGATSVDGIHWHKTDKPLLIAPADRHFPPEADPQRVGDFHRPSLLWDEGKWKLYFDYYHAGIPGNCHVGLAENTGDFRTGEFRITHPLDQPVMENWPNPDVVKIGTGYYCFSDPGGYDGAEVPEGKSSGWAQRQLRMAVSSNGISWEKKEFIPSDPGIVASHVPQAFVCKREGKWWLYLFYATQIGWRDNGRRYDLFGPGEYNWFSDQIRYMRQEIK